MKYGKEELARHFDEQITILKDRGCPEQIIGLLTPQKNLVIPKASEIVFENGHIPFLPVIPQTYQNSYDLMAMVRNGNKQGHTYLNLATITDKIETPKGLYYIYNVEDGGSTKDKSPEKVREIFKEQSRSPLTAAEIIALCALTDVLSRHSVWAAGSCCDEPNRAPLIHLDIDSRPKLICFYINTSRMKWGSASCVRL